jgi:hypothetical protein
VIQSALLTILVLQQIDTKSNELPGFASSKSLDLLKRRYEATLKSSDYRIKTLEAELDRAMKKNGELELENRELRKKFISGKREPFREIPLPSTNSNILSMLKTPSSKKQKTVSEQHLEINTRSDEHRSQVSSESSDLIPTQFSLPDTDNQMSSPEKNTFIQTQRRTLGSHSNGRRGSIDLSDAAPGRFTKQESKELTVKEEQLDETHIPVSSPVIVKQESSDSSSDLEEIKDSFDDSQDNFALSWLTPNTDSKYETPANNRHREFMKRNIQQLNTPTEPRPFKQPKGPLDLSKHPTKHRDWIIEDFKVNPKKNDNTDYAYHVVLRGASRKCVHGKTCQDCDRFYKSMGDLQTEATGPRWNDDMDTEGSDIVKTTSRHRDLWEKPESPPGFGQFDFPATQERKEHKQKAQMMKKRIAYERLYSALKDQRWIFKYESFNKAVEQGCFEVDKAVFLNNLKHDE